MTLKQFLLSIDYNSNPRIMFLDSDGAELCLHDGHGSKRLDDISFRFVQYYADSKISVSFPIDEDTDILVRIIRYFAPSVLRCF